MKSAQINGQVIIGKETCLRLKKIKTAKKKQKWFKVSQFYCQFSEEKNDLYQENFSQLVSEYSLCTKLLFKSHLKH